MDAPLPQSQSEAKRVVYVHSCGLRQIMGLSGPPYPSYYEFTSGNGATTRPASLISVSSRYVLYREIVVPPSGRFNDFHPEQV
mgnify:CR=1 FL=1